MNRMKRAGATALAAPSDPEPGRLQRGGDQTAEVKAAQAKLDAATSLESVYRTEMDYSMADADGEAVSILRDQPDEI